MTGRRRPARRAPVAAAVVVDTPVAVQWFVNEPGSATAARLLDEEHVLIGPDIMPLEAANAWWEPVAPVTSLTHVERS